VKGCGRTLSPPNLAISTANPKEPVFARWMVLDYSSTIRDRLEWEKRHSGICSARPSLGNARGKASENPAGGQPKEGEQCSMANYRISPPGSIHTLDLNFMGIAGTIASYLITHPSGGILIESGPGSTTQNLTRALARHGLKPADISDVFLTHIHLDHGGAAGWLARQGARIHVHPRGAPHLINPEKLLNSAARIYGDRMETMWGEFLPVPETQLSILEDGEQVEVEGLRIQALDTPGHANHHHAYLYEEFCFSGDIGGVRLNIAPGHLRLPMPPPEFQLEAWRESLKRLSEATFSYIAPTHFGIYDDPQAHLAALAKSLDEIEAWMQASLPANPPVEEINAQYRLWTQQRSLGDGLSEDQIQAHETANPTWMSGFGMQRYWQKYRTPGSAGQIKTEGSA
jgi:glyoxylase-like metal-dependent hydrolase (beta-lactamase superfamily II)